MQKIKFTKMHGIGNDYIYINCFEQKIEDPQKLAIRMSPRRTSVGSDGLILICPSDTADAKMRMFNMMFFSYRVVNSAMDKILVVNEGGELLRFKAMQQDLLYESLLKNHCYHTAYYLNSFDRLSLQENRARALFLVNKPDANTIFAKYQADRGYGDALELGVVYRTEFEKMLSVSVSGDEYHVTFSSVLSIINGNDVRKIRILSEGTVIRTTPRFPENTSGFFFRTYNQQYEMP